MIHACVGAGHELKNLLCAIFEYLDANACGCMPGAVVLGGWPALPWGHLGKGPAPASLQPLVEIGVDEDMLQRMIDYFFNFDEEKGTPPNFMQDGSLRSAVEWAFATVIM